jgi:hypothetical protein
MITAEMTSAERVAEFLRMQRGAWYCDGCISESTAVLPSNQVKQITRPLALTSDYQRADSTHCNRCGRYRKCIRMRLAAA